MPVRVAQGAEPAMVIGTGHA
ncbi:Hypothetical protein PFCIRM119_01005 [Propionibacterium freudenreichii]|uniref:Uncharacterized protein n=2 Tax=Propionibacterium freudenreichii TaxID=1744 RepID=D7GEV0_PROFC|nr:Hypothetical protein PFREUD_15630 [Propionibacterium freudenreichii subsp. shermanii CIRM-BIA1]CDP49377.1 Hypothetical protein PFCIRM129_11560 [Propionibacterium freudenreichii subsp. freudenreichii]CEG86016.1 Hypothetical protein PFCIRM118_04225 [Propionibacterium freudenreichii]CEG90295.1 Hypothetical protein PFCIRM119_01005 [Propionibacterium freudenreichii]CEG91846.1 Hypothetical protein PFCIRM121_01175 [Propionibacterium freudenreichii]